MNTDLIRALFRRAYAESSEGHPMVTETFFLSSPSIPGFAPSEVDEHVQQLVAIGFLRPSRDIVMKNRPDYQPVTYRPTSDAFEWARNAWEDARWLANVGAMTHEIARRSASRPSA